MCVSQEKYREDRDLYALDFYIRESCRLCKWVSEEENARDLTQGLNLTYNELIDLVETIKQCCDIADQRVRNWQKYCLGNPDCLPFLLDTSVRGDESVAAYTLKLLLWATSLPPALSDKTKKMVKTSVKASAPSARTIGGRESKPPAPSPQTSDKSMSQQLTQQILSQISDDSLLQFLRHFLLEMNSTAIRWSAHALCLNLFRWVCLSWSSSFRKISLEVAFLFYGEFFAFLEALMKVTNSGW